MKARGFFSTSHVAGALLVLGVLFLVGTAVSLARQGRLKGMEAAFRGVHAGSQDASGLREVGRAGVVLVTTQLAGFTLVTLLLHRAGDPGVGPVALALLVVWSAISLIESSFHASVTVWAAREAARTGSAPAFYEPVRRWLNTELQYTNMGLILASLALFSGSALRYGLVPRWAGIAAVIWSILAIPLYYSVLAAPAVFILTPLLLGVGLLAKKGSDRFLGN